MIAPKLLMGLVSAAGALWILRSPRLERLPPEAARRLFWVLTVTGPVVSAAVVYGVLGYAVPSDATGWYLTQARAVLGGGIPHVDVPSSYAGLFGYLSALLVWVWDDALVFVAAAILFNLLNARLWLILVFEWLPAPDAARAVLLYATSSHVLVNVVVGQNQVWLAAALAAAVWLQVRRRDAASGVALGLGLSAVKILALLFVPALWPASRRRSIWFAGFAAIVLLSHGVQAGMGADILMPLRRELPRVTSGNLPYVLSALGFDPGGFVGIVALGVGVLGAVLLFMRLRSEREIEGERILHACVVMLLIMMVLSKKAYTSYLGIAFLPLCVTAVRSPDRLHASAFALLTLLATIEPSLWFRWFPGRDLAAVLASGGTRGAVFAVTEVCLVGCYLLLLRRATRLALAATPSHRTCRRKGEPDTA